MAYKLPLVASLLAACLGQGFFAPLHADDAPAPVVAVAATPDAAVAAWIAALKNNDVTSFYTALPPARQTEMANAWKVMTAGGEVSAMPAPAPVAGDPVQPPAGAQGGLNGVGQGRRGPRNMLTMMLDRPLQNLQATESAKVVADMFAGILGQFAVLVQPATAPAPAMPAAPEGQPWMQFMQRGLAQNALSSSVNGLLAAGLETRQFAALQALFDDYALWAAKGLDDPAKQTAATEHLVALGAALQLKSASDLSTLELNELFTRSNAALPALKQTLLAYGLDANAVLASATVAVESTTVDSSIVVVSFTAFAKPHQLPLKLLKGANGWAIAADSPALRWMNAAGGQGGMGGMMRGGQGRQRGQGGQGGGQGGAQGGQPAPAPGGANF